MEEIKNFNSTMVRLKVSSGISEPYIFVYFNSTMVRLKGGGICGFLFI